MLCTFTGYIQTSPEGEDQNLPSFLFSLFSSTDDCIEFLLLIVFGRAVTQISVQTPAVLTAVSIHVSVQTPAVLTAVPIHVSVQIPAVLTAVPIHVSVQTPAVLTAVPIHVSVQTPAVQTAVPHTNIGADTGCPDRSPHMSRCRHRLS
jgi:hypothetical protein